MLRKKKHPFEGKHLSIPLDEDKNNKFIQEIINWSSLEYFSLTNKLHVLITPIITTHVKNKKERHFKKTGSRILKTNFFLFDGLKRIKIVRENVGKAGALAIIYNFWETVTFFELFLPTSWIEAFWASSLNCKSVRNRYRLIRSILSMAIYRIYEGDTNKNIEILEVAAGSSQVLIKTIAYLKRKNIIVRAKLIDIDEKSLESARKLAEKLGVLDQIETKTQNLFKYFSNEDDGRSFDIIEMVGIADYLTDEQKDFVYGSSYKKLNNNGFLITANICDNPEREFIHTVADWPEMIYRNESDMSSFITKAGFVKNLVFKEPLGVYIIAVGEKVNS